MKRWTFFVSATLLTTVALVGCSEPVVPTEGEKGGSGTSSTSETGGSVGSETTSTSGAPETGTTGAVETTGTSGAPESMAVADKPKDGEDVAVLETSAGKIVVMFYPQKAPNHVANFKELAGKGFYNGTRFHRCIPGFMIQGGDPNSKDLAKSSSWGMGGNTEGGKEKNVAAEFNDVSHVRGILSMARSQDPNSASSQFFIMVADNTGLDGQYTAFGKAISGMEVADKIVQSGDAGNNGAVDPPKAFVLKSVRITKWPVK
jgi:peptidyl-prolyl cis-trans isomerase B (cyclophilin B)